MTWVRRLWRRRPPDRLVRPHRGPRCGRRARDVWVRAWLVALALAVVQEAALGLVRDAVRHVLRWLLPVTAW